jgi:outer membrane protein assembly factor BamE (lipoprotein component of BamABCDE complex)
MHAPQQIFSLSDRFKQNYARVRLMLLLAPLIMLLGCASVGKEFPDAQIGDIQIGKTTKTDIQNLFGSPWRVGVENGEESWTYGRYRYKLIGKASTKDLVIRFDKKNVVTSYVFNTTDHSS